MLFTFRTYCAKTFIGFWFWELTLSVTDISFLSELLIQSFIHNHLHRRCWIFITGCVSFWYVNKTIKSAIGAIYYWKICHQSQRVDPDKAFSDGYGFAMFKHLIPKLVNILFLIFLFFLAKYFISSLWTLCFCVFVATFLVLPALLNFLFYLTGGLSGLGR